jgi:hypothetical protein
VLTTSGWTSEAPVFASPPGTGRAAWVELVARPNSDEITLLYEDTNQLLFVATWDGTAWGLGSLLGTDPIALAGDRCFDAAYETTSGNLLAAWGTPEPNGAGTGMAVKWAIRPAGASAFGPATQDTYFKQAGLLRLASDPASDRIALTMLEYYCGAGDCSDLMTGIWDGSTWVKSDPDSAIGFSYYNHDWNAADVAWSGGNAIAVYSRVSQAIDWATWTSTNGWVLQPPAAASPPFTEKASIVLAPLRGEVLALISDVNGALWAKAFDGVSWRDTEPSGALATDPSLTSGIPFAFTRP